MTTRPTIGTAEHPIGQFAVFRHLLSNKAARFVVLRETQAEAMAECERLAAQVIATHGTSEQVCYYAVEVVGRAGIINGRLTSEQR